MALAASFTATRRPIQTGSSVARDSNQLSRPEPMQRPSRPSAGHNNPPRRQPLPFSAGSRSQFGFAKIWQFRPRATASVSPREVGRFWREPEIARVEAVLFLAREPLSSRKIAQLASLADGTEARTLVRRLNRLYDECGCAFRAEEVAGGYQLVTRSMFGPWLRRMLQTSVETRLSGPALETLSVVAYRQPVVRAEIEAIRGVQCGEMLRQLMERDLIRIAGRADDLGRPLLYGTTKRFLELFGLKHLDDLPRAAELRAGGLPSSQEKAKNNANNQDNSGMGRIEAKPSHDRLSEEESVTTRIRPDSVREEFVEGTATALLEASHQRMPIQPVSAVDEDDDLDDEDEDWDDDEEDEDEEDDDFVDEEWEEVDDDEEEEDDAEEDDDWEDDDDDDWDDDDDDLDDDED